MIKKQFVAVPILLGSVLLANGCANGSSPGAALYPPQYAAPSGMQWLVRCPLSSRFIDEHRLEQFYRGDGMAKTYEEFCREGRTSSLIKRRKKTNEQ